MPTSTFFNLPEAKQKNIIEISYEEFSENLYEKASIRNIIKKANISTGAFYRYFESKDELYLYVIDYKFGEAKNLKENKSAEDLSKEKFWVNFKLSSSEIRKKYYFRVKNNLLYDLRLEQINDMKLKKLTNEKDKSAIAFLIAVLPYIVQELYDLTGDKYYDDDDDDGNSSWMMLRNIICEGLNSINSK